MMPDTRSLLMKRLAEIMPKKPETWNSVSSVMRVEMHPIRQSAESFLSWLGDDLPADRNEMLATLWVFGEILNGEMERMLNVSNRLQSDLLNTMPFTLADCPYCAEGDPGQCGSCHNTRKVRKSLSSQPDADCPQCIAERLIEKGNVPSMEPYRQSTINCLDELLSDGMPPDEFGNRYPRTDVSKCNRCRDTGFYCAHCDKPMDECECIDDGSKNLATCNCTFPNLAEKPLPVEVDELMRHDESRTDEKLRQLIAATDAEADRNDGREPGDTRDEESLEDHNIQGLGAYRDVFDADGEQ